MESALARCPSDATRRPPYPSRGAEERNSRHRRICAGENSSCVCLFSQCFPASFQVQVGQLEHSGTCHNPPAVPRVASIRRSDYSATPAFVHRHCIHMQKLLAGLLLIASTSCASFRPQAATDATPTVAIRGVNVVDVESGRVLPDKTVLIADDRIVTIGRAEDVQVPGSARVIDGAGKYLIPGLWDMHTHVMIFGREALPLLLAHGVTGIRDMGAERFAEAKALRDSINAGLRLGPRMKIASPIVEKPTWLEFSRKASEKAGVPWTAYERFGPSSPQEAVRWVDSVARLGADHIKVRNWPVPEIGRALVTRAEELGIPVTAHANEPFPRAGVATYEHHVWPPLKVSRAARDSLWSQWAAQDVAFVPTLVMWPPRTASPDSLLTLIDSGTLPGIRYVPARTREAWRKEVLLWAQDEPAPWNEIVDAAVRDLREMHKASVRVAAGTDIGAPLMVPGLSLHDELTQLATMAGLSPLEVLQAATLTSARVLGLEDSLGSVEVGKFADLVLLDANPLENVENMRRVDAVIFRGRLLDRQDIQNILNESELTARSQASMD